MVFVIANEQVPEGNLRTDIEQCETLKNVDINSSGKNRRLNRYEVNGQGIERQTSCGANILAHLRMSRCAHELLASCLQVVNFIVDFLHIP